MGIDSHQPAAGTDRKIRRVVTVECGLGPRRVRSGYVKGGEVMNCVLSWGILIT
jgi:hypothetical protein